MHSNDSLSAHFARKYSMNAIEDITQALKKIADRENTPADDTATCYQARAIIRGLTVDLVELKAECVSIVYDLDLTKTRLHSSREALKAIKNATSKGQMRRIAIQALET